MDKSPPLPLAKVIDRVKANLRKAKRAKRLGTVERRWAEIAGPAVAAATKVRDLSAGVLVIEVDSSPLKAELEGFERDRLLDELVERVNFTRIHGLRFVLKGS